MTNAMMMLAAVAAAVSLGASGATGGLVDVTSLGVRNDGSADVSGIVNEATKTSALYFPPGRYLVEKPIKLRHSIYGKGFSRTSDKTAGEPEPDDTRTWFISRLSCTNGTQAIVSFGGRNVNVEEVNFMCNSAETAIRVLPKKPGNRAFLSRIGIYRLGGTGISIECQGSRSVFIQDVCICGSSRKFYTGSRGILLCACDCRLSNIEVMAVQIGLDIRSGYTYGENMHLWTGCTVCGGGDKAAWWKGTRGIKLAGGGVFVGSNIYPDTSYHPFEFVGDRCQVDIRGIMYWDDRSENGCADHDGALLKCDPGVDPCLKIDGGFWGVNGNDANPYWMKYLYQPKAEIRNVTVRSMMSVSGGNLDTLCMNTDLPSYRVSYATNGWCKVAEVFVTERSGSCEGTLTLDDGAAWTLSFLKTPDAPARMEVRPLNALCAGREIGMMSGDGTLKAFLRCEGPFAGRFVTSRMTPRFRPVDWGHLITHKGAVRYREVRCRLK